METERIKEKTARKEHRSEKNTNQRKHKQEQNVVWVLLEIPLDRVHRSSTQHLQTRMKTTPFKISSFSQVIPQIIHNSAQRDISQI